MKITTNYKIRNLTPQTSEQVQRICIAQGMVWVDSRDKKVRLTDKPILYIRNSEMQYGEQEYNFERDEAKGITAAEFIRLYSEEPIETNASANKLRGTKQYSSWYGMRSRTGNKKQASYERYGGRGIKVCKKWETFEGFWDDMGESYSDGLTLDRIDNNGDYCKENCKWSTRAEQSRNTSRNRNFTHEGETKCLSDWADVSGIAMTTLHRRLGLGWDIGRAITTKPAWSWKRQGQKNKPNALFAISCNEDAQRLLEFSEKSGFTIKKVFQTKLSSLMRRKMFVVSVYIDSFKRKIYLGDEASKRGDISKPQEDVTAEAFFKKHLG
jgi:hypothetical protein